MDIQTRGTSFTRTCFNMLNALSGIGLISMPYALSQTGWLGLAFLLSMAIVTCYTGFLLKRCMSKHSIESYPEVGEVAFGRKGRLFISAFMYIELYLVPIGFLILEADNLHKLFPNFNFHSFGGKRLFTVIAGLIILPTMWLDNLSMLSFVSAGGVLASAVVISSTLYTGAFEGVGFSAKGKVFNLSGIPTALSLYAFSYGSHPVFPTMYSSMQDKTRFSKVLIVGFGLSTMMYISMAVIGYLMFGQNVQSEITLSLPTKEVSSKIAIYTILVVPLAKYALIISPISFAIQDRFLPDNYKRYYPIRLLTRTLLLLSTVIVALVFPYFELLIALIGAILNITVSILLPCICYLKIVGADGRRYCNNLESVTIVGIIVIAISVGVMGSYSSIKQTIKQL